MAQSLLPSSRIEAPAHRGRGRAVAAFTALLLLLSSMTTAATASPASRPTLGSGVPGSNLWLTDQAGRVHAFGAAPHLGDARNLPLNQPVVGMTASASGRGYWLLARDGGVFTFGDARFYGSTGGMRLNQPVNGIARTNTGRGYWLVASDGGIFAFGDARFYGSTGGMHLNQPVNGMAATPSGRGYWLVASDGGIFAFGDANFYGSAVGARLGAPTVGIAPTPTGRGYVIASANGRVAAYGDARHHGDPSSLGLPAPIARIQMTPDGGGYWLVDTTGRVYPYGNAGNRVSAPLITSGTMVGIATTGELPPQIGTTSRLNNIDTTVYDMYGPPLKPGGAPYGAHEALPVGLPSHFDFYTGGRSGMWAGTPGTGRAVSGWGQVFEAQPGTGTYDVRLQVRDHRMYFLLSDGRWVNLRPNLTDPAMEGDWWNGHFQSQGSSPVRRESGGGWSVSLAPLAQPNNANWHFWWNGWYPREPIPANAVGVYAVAEMRLIPDGNPSVDLNRARFIGSIGVDNYSSTTYSSGGEPIAAVMQPRMKFVTPEWKSFSGTNLTEAQLRANPPPFG